MSLVGAAVEYADGVGISDKIRFVRTIETILSDLLGLRIRRI